MLSRRYVAGAVLFLSFTMATWTWAQKTGKPLTEQNLAQLLDLEIDEATLVRKVTQEGIGFAVDEAVLDRLKKAGASEALLQALEKASKATPAAGGKAITFQDITKLLELGIDETTILKRLEKSPTVFVLDAKQVVQLKEAGASATLLAALAGQRPAPQQASDVTDFAIVLDCSGSMKELTTEGQSKMEVAKRVVADLVKNIPEGLNVTFVIYGHEVFGGADDPRNCQAVKIVRPLSPLDASGKTELAAFIGKLKPTGGTPIALALKTAGEELAKNDALCGMVLITDGLESCQGDPAGEAAALLSKLKLTFGIHVVGFDVKPEESDALKQVADAGKGKYYNATSAAELNAALQKLRKDLEKAAPEPPKVEFVTSAVSAIVLSLLTVDGFPAIEEVFLTKPDTNPHGPTFRLSGIVQSQKVLGKPMLVPPGEYNVVYQPEGAEYLVTLVKNIKVPAKQTVKINTNRSVAAISVKDPRIDGFELQKSFASVPGENPNGPVYVYSLRQSTDKFDQVMMVTAGDKYDIVLKPQEGQSVTIFEAVEPKGGQLTVVGGDDEIK